MHEGSWSSRSESCESVVLVVVAINAPRGSRRRPSIFRLLPETGSRVRFGNSVWTYSDMNEKWALLHGADLLRSFFTIGFNRISFSRMFSNLSLGCAVIDRSRGIEGRRLMEGIEPLEEVSFSYLPAKIERRAELG